MTVNTDNRPNAGIDAGGTALWGRRLAAAGQAWRITLIERLRTPDERGEGVISMAIAVLIIAFLGAAAWLAFKGLLDSTKDKAEVQIARVGG